MTPTPSPQPARKQFKFKKPLIIASFVLNGLFVLYLIAVEIILPPILEEKLFYAQLNAMHTYYCEEKYDYALNRIDNESNPEQREQQKMVYAMTNCGKNYKNGQPLDLQPLTDQVNNTSPKTDF